MPRIPYVNVEDMSEEDRPILEKFRRPDGRFMNVHRMLAHCPGLMRDRVVYARNLNTEKPNSLNSRLRELAQIAVGFFANAIYEYHHHVHRGLAAGLTPEHVMGLAVWRQHQIYTPQERAVIAYAEEMTKNIRVSDETFEALRPHFSTQGIVELTMVISHYNSTVRFLEALKVEPDSEGGV